VSGLNEKGIPTPLVRTMLRAPMSRMDILSSKEIKNTISNSKIYNKYTEVIDRESAYEILSKRIQKSNAKEEEDEKRKKTEKRKSSSRKSTRMNPILKVVTSATFIRGVLGVLKKLMK